MLLRWYQYLDPLETLFGKRENTGYHTFSFSHNVFINLLQGGETGSLPNDKILDETKWKAFADDKINVAQVTVSVFDRIENSVGKGENVGYQYFLHFP